MCFCNSNGSANLAWSMNFGIFVDTSQRRIRDVYLLYSVPASPNYIFSSRVEYETSQSR